MLTPSEIDARLRARKQQRAKPAAFAELARWLRRRHHLSQQDIAEMIGATRSAVARWETGSRRPRGPVRDRYAQLLAKLAKEQP